jgi:hypothetical protein
MRRLLVCSLFFLSCTPAQLEHLKETTWHTGRCSLFSSLSCAGQSLGKCSVDNTSASLSDFGDCLVESTSSCVSKGIGRCALSGAMKAAGTSLIVAGGVSCTTEQNKSLVKQCFRELDPKTQSDAVYAVAECWMDVCSD